MYNANSVSISTIVYDYFIYLRATGKTIASGAEDDSIYYQWIRSSTAPRAIELTVASIRHGIVV